MKIGEMNAVIQGASHTYNIWIKDRSGKWLFEIFEKRVGSSEKDNSFSTILSKAEVKIALADIWEGILSCKRIEDIIDDIIVKTIQVM